MHHPLCYVIGVTIEKGNFKNISMGQGQEKPAEAVVEEFAKSGGWVMLQNLHLMASWVPKLGIHFFDVLFYDFSKIKQSFIVVLCRTFIGNCSRNGS